MAVKPTYKELEQKVKELEKETFNLRQAEGLLRKREQKLEELLSVSPVAIYRCEPKDNFPATFITENVRNQLGYEPHEFTESSDFWVSHIHPDDAPRILSNLTDLFERGSHVHEYRFLHKDGTYRWIYDELRMIYDVDGKPTDIVGIWMDITDRRKIEEALRESEKKYRLLADNITDNIWTLDLETLSFSYVSPSVVGIMGYTAEEATGLHLQDVLTPSSLEIATKILSEELSEDGRNADPSRSRTLELEQYRKDGTTVWTEVSVRFIRDTEGRPSSILGVTRDVTERKRAEEALHESEDKYRTLVEQLPSAVYTAAIDEASTTLFVSPQVEKILGFKPDEWKKDHDIWLMQIHPDDRERVLAEVEASHKSEGPFSSEYRMITRNGRTIWIRDQAKIVRDDKGRPIVLQGMISDITESMQREAQIMEWRNRYEAAILASGHLLYDWNSETNDVTYGGDLEGILGYTLDEMEGGLSRWLELIHPEDHNYFNKTIEHLITANEPAHMEYRVRRKDGKYIIVEDNGHFITDEQGNMIQMIGFVKDITDRVQTEKALRESEEKYRTVLESNPDPVVVYDMEGRVIYLNPAFTLVFGWALEEQIGKKMDNFVPEENWPETRMMINKVTVLGESFSGIETRRFTKKGEILDISISGSCYRDQEGNIAASVINLRDITAQKRLEAQLQQAQKMEAIATLAGGVAHEFNNALMGIMGNIELLKMDLSEDERRDKYFGAMKGSGHRMSRLTDQLLAYAQGGKYQPKNLKLDDFVIQTLPILQHNLSPTVRVETHFPKEISYIKADNAQMQMVLSAILANSNEAIEDEGLIRITAENKDVDEDFTKQHPGLKPGDYVCLTIKDNGKGMNEEEREKVFDPFFTTKFQGRGMGMAAVYGIVKNHDGWIYVDSELGRGTTVRIYLPAIDIEIEEPKKAEVEVVRGSGTILMIEDEDVVIEVTQAMLEMLGYRVMVAKTGKDAIHITETFDGDIDLALLDIKLPDMEGGKVYPLIMKARPDLKVIVFSGYAIDGPARKILDAGAQGFIQKPFSLATLSEKLKEVLERK